MTKDRTTVLLLGDIVALALSFVIMVLIRFSGNEMSELVGLQSRIFAFLFLIWLAIFFIFDLYNLRKVNPNPRNIGFLGLAVAVSTIISGLLFYLFATDGITPKTNLAIVAVVAFLFLLMWRRSFYRLFVSTYTQRIAIIGNGVEVDHLVEDIKHNPLIGTIVAKHDVYTPGMSLKEANLVIADHINLRTLMEISESSGAEVLSLSGAYEELFGKIPLTLMSEDRAISMLTRQRQAVTRLFGRIIDTIVALLVLAIASPFLLIAMIAIAMEDGAPIFYRQTRVGKNGALFSIFKLRSMRRDAEANGVQWAQKKDPRSTNVGRVLRKLHIDEVPQMLNVLSGDIALIGPRPERPELVAQLEKEIPYYFLRHAVKPGFTGWAQIKFRYARTLLDSREKFEYDLYYLAHKDPMFDFGILLKTIQIIFTH